MKILHTADIHFDAANQEAALASLTTLAETAERERPDFIVIAGDLFNRAVSDTAASGLPRLLDVFKRIRYAAPIYAIYGTPTHDLPGCYAPLEAADLVEVISPGTTITRGDCLVMGLPESTREWLLAGAEGKSAQETAEAMKTALRGILLGLGAIRAQHPEIPCVMIYHGTVEGASMQNGQLVGAGDITIGREDLALVGADYYALGHIHLAQQISGMPAYYPGSAYPVNWGELGQSGFNLVEINADQGPVDGHPNFHMRRTDVTRIPFPHPRRVKFSLPWPEAVAAEDVAGIQAWICIRATKEQAAEIDADAIREAYIEEGALPGSRVTVELIPTETVRAAEITEKHRLSEKVAIWADATTGGGGVAGPAIMAKADALEREAAERGESQKTDIEIQKVRLHGAKGIYKGRRLFRRLFNLPALPLDDLEIDFRKYDAGPLALIGPTGSGKTTLLSFLAPFSDMPSRRGPLRNHFRLRDSQWELLFLEKYSGCSYRLLVEIDGVNATGTCSYHLFRDDAPLTNGRLAEFDETVKKLFGSPELFVRRCYVAQKAGKDNPDLSEATKGERKAIVRQLAGLDYLQAYAESAKAKGNTIEAEISVERGRITLIESQLEALPGIRKDVDAKRTALDSALVQQAQTRIRGEALKIEVEALTEKVSEQKSIGERIAGLEDQETNRRQVIAGAQNLIAGYQKAVAQQPAAQKALDAWTALKEQEGKENERITEASREAARITAEYGRVQKAHSDACRALEATKSSLRTQSAHVVGNRNVLEAQVKHLQAALDTPAKACPKCGYMDPAAEQERVANAGKLAGLTEDVVKASAEIKRIDGEIAAIVLPPEPRSPEVPPVDAAPLLRIRAALAGLNVEAARKTLTAAQEAATRLDETRKQLAQAEEGAAELAGEIVNARELLDATIGPAHEAAQERYEAARREYGEAQKCIAGLEAQIKGLEARIAELEATEKDLGARKLTDEEKARDLGEWRYLETACGPDGIQALELDAFKPTIEATANALLSAVFGSRFTIDIKTTRDAGRGANSHQVEDFAIWIIDNEDDGSRQEFFSLSGGESVPVRLAIYEAFARVCEQKFSPMILDEADGQLDPSLRAGYVDMIARAETASGRRNTILISHDVGVQEMVAQKIDMGEIAKIEMRRGAA